MSVREYTRRTRLFLGLLLGLLSVCAARAADPGQITHNGVEMPIKAGVAVWDAQRPGLTLYLLPFSPSAADTEGLQREGIKYLWNAEHPSPDPARWPDKTPFASYGLSWFDKADSSDLRKGLVYVYTFSIDKPYTNMNLNFGADDEGNELSLDGKLAAGESITLRAAGNGSIGDDEQISWKFAVTTTVVADLSK